MRFDDIVWGDVGTWVAGIATVLAFITAFYFSRRQERRSVEMELANVYAWMEYGDSPDSDGTTSDDWSLVVNNRTEAPLYKWTVRIWWQVDGKEDKDLIGEDDLGIIPPGLRVYPLSEASQLPNNDAQVRVAIDFVDRLGQFRTRTETGAMIKHPRRKRPNV